MYKYVYVFIYRRAHTHTRARARACACVCLLRVYGTVYACMRACVSTRARARVHSPVCVRCACVRSRVLYRVYRFFLFPRCFSAPPFHSRYLNLVLANTVRSFFFQLSCPLPHNAHHFSRRDANMNYDHTHTADTFFRVQMKIRSNCVKHQIDFFPRADIVLSSLCSLPRVTNVSQNHYRNWLQNDTSSKRKPVRCQSRTVVLVT